MKAAISRARSSRPSGLRRLSRWLCVALAALASPPPCRDQDHIGCTATSDCASAMVAVDQGIFAKHGLDAKMILIGINSNIPAAIVSDSIQIGGPTESVFLQAVDGGLDLVAVEGASSMDPSTNEAIAAFARTGVDDQRGQGFRRQESRRARHRRLPAGAVRQMAGRKRRRSQIGEFRRSDLPDHERHAEIGRRRRRA